MDKSQKLEDMSFFQIPEPTEEEIERAIEKVKNKYDVVISRADAIKYTKLNVELGRWITVEKMFHTKDGCVTEDMAKEVQKFTKQRHGRDITLEEAYGEAKDSFALTILHEKERVAGEIRTLVSK